MKKKNCMISVLAAAILSCTLISSCGSDPVYEPDAFDLAVMAFDPPYRVSYAKFDSIAQLIEGSHCELIVRCTVGERHESAEFEAPEGRLYTPYTLNVIETYLGEAGNTLTFNAAYGVIGDEVWRNYHAPLMKQGCEYLLFLRTDDSANNGGYWNAFLPLAVELLPDGTFTNEYAAYADVNLAEAAGSTDALIAAIRDYCSN